MVNTLLNLTEMVSLITCLSLRRIENVIKHVLDIEIIIIAVMR